MRQILVFEEENGPSKVFGKGRYSLANGPGAFVGERRLVRLLPIVCQPVFPGRGVPVIMPSKNIPWNKPLLHLLP